MIALIKRPAGLFFQADFSSLLLFFLCFFLFSFIILIINYSNEFSHGSGKILKKNKNIDLMLTK